MIHLEHIFAANLRFDTEVQYLAQRGARSRYENLPILKSGCTTLCALTSLLQCAAMLARQPRRELLAKRRDVRKVLQASQPISDQMMLDGVKALDASLAAEVLHSQGAAEIGTAALASIQSGNPCLLLYETVELQRWACVVGVEAQRHSQRARALLLLDSSGSEPWACGHNARIELHATAGKSVRTSAGFMLNCRHLTGEACAVRLHRLIVLTRSATSLAPMAATAS